MERYTLETNYYSIEVGGGQRGTVAYVQVCDIVETSSNSCGANEKGMNQFMG